MNLYPKMKCKPIEQCEPGELIRLRLATDSDWAFMATNLENNKILVILPIPPNKWPHHSLLPNYTKYVLSYGKDWNILVDQDSTNVNLEADQSYGCNDMLILDGARHLLVMHHPDNFPRMFLYLDLTSCKIVDPPKGRFTTFSKWSVEVSVGGDRFQTLVSFLTESEKEGLQ